MHCKAPRFILQCGEDVCRGPASTLLLYRGLEQLGTLVFAEIPKAHPQQEHLYEMLPKKG